MSAECNWAEPSSHPSRQAIWLKRSSSAPPLAHAWMQWVTGLGDADASGGQGLHPAPIPVLNTEVLTAVPRRGGTLHGAHGFGLCLPLCWTLTGLEVPRLGAVRADVVASLLPVLVRCFVFMARGEAVVLEALYHALQFFMLLRYLMAGLALIMGVSIIVVV